MSYDRDILNFNLCILVIAYDFSYNFDFGTYD